MIKTLFVVLMFGYGFNLTSVAGPMKQTVGGKLAAVNEALLEKAIAYSQNDNKKALTKLEKAFLILSLKPGIKVEEIKTSERNESNIKIRLIDDELELWTTSDAVKIIPKKKPGQKGGEDAAETDSKTKTKKTKPADDSSDDEDDEWE